MFSIIFLVESARGILMFFDKLNSISICSLIVADIISANCGVGIISSLAADLASRMMSLILVDNDVMVSSILSLMVMRSTRAISSIVSRVLLLHLRMARVLLMVFTMHRKEVYCLLDLVRRFTLVWLLVRLVRQRT